MTSPEKNPSDPLSGTGTTQMQGTSQTQRGTEATQREGGHLTEHARRKAGELAGDLKRQAEESAEDILQRARSAVDEQKETAIGGIEGVAHALRSASDDLRERGQPLAAEYSRQVADGLESLANWVGRRNIDDVRGGLEDFARQRPVAFIGGAMVAGFALARFMKSSSARRYRRTGAYGSYRRHEAYGGMGSAGTRTGAGAGTTAPGTARYPASGSWSPGSAERDAGSIGMPGVERNAGTIATPGVGIAGRPGAGSAGTPGTAGAETSRAGTAGTPGAGGYGRGGLWPERARRLMQQTDDRSLKELLGDLTQNVTTLFRKEIELARAETSEKITQAGVAAGLSIGTESGPLIGMQKGPL